MGVHGGPDIVEDGLVFAIDAGNGQSYVSGSGNCFSLIGNITGSLSDDNGSGMYSSDNQGTWVFDGVDDNIHLENVIPLGVISVSFWMKSSHSSDNDSITTGLGGLGVIGTSPLLRQGSSNYKYFADQSAKLDGNWHHWSFSIAGSGTSDIDDAKMYVDGVELAAGTIVNSGAPDAWTVSKIGTGTYGYFNCNISSFQTYNKILSTAEVLQNYNTTKERFI